MTHIEKRKERKEKGQKLSQFLNLVKSFKVRQSFFGTSFWNTLLTQDCISCVTPIHGFKHTWDVLCIKKENVRYTVLSFRAKICLIPHDFDIECEVMMWKTNYEHALNLMAAKANNYKDMCLLKKNDEWMKKWKMKWKMRWKMMMKNEWLRMKGKEKWKDKGSRWFMHNMHSYCLN